MANALDEIRRQLREGRFPSERAISQGVVLRILSELGWNQFDTETVWPEFTVGPRRVDFALCYPAKLPKVFVEVKQVGQADGADQQLFEYAFHQGGIPLAVLTDGKVWGFYLPGEQGSYEERRVYKLDLLERSVEESVEKLTKYLEFARVASGVAIEDAKKDYQDRNRRTLARQTVPVAWKDLVESEDPSIFDRVSSEVETKCGVKPELDDLLDFFRRLGSPIASRLPLDSALQQEPRSSADRLPSRPSATGFTLRGRTFPATNAKGVMLGVFRAFAAEDPTFVERFYRHEGNTGRRRTYVARSVEEMYPNRPDLWRYSDEFIPGWFIATNLSNESKQKLIELACKVAGLRLGSDLNFAF